LNYLSENIKFIRVLKELSQEQLAEDLKVSRSRISSYEDKRAVPSIDFLINLSEYINISMEELIKKKLDKLEV